MEKKIKTMTVSHQGMLDTLQIIHTLKKTSGEDTDEVLLMDSLNWKLLDSMETTESGCTVKLNEADSFAVWLTLDRYKDFLLDTGLTEDVQQHEQLMACFMYNKIKGGC